MSVNAIKKTVANELRQNWSALEIKRRLKIIVSNSLAHYDPWHTIKTFFKYLTVSVTSVCFKHKERSTQFLLIILINNSLIRILRFF